MQSTSALSFNSFIVKLAAAVATGAFLGLLLTMAG